MKVQEIIPHCNFYSYNPKSRFTNWLPFAPRDTAMFSHTNLISLKTNNLKGCYIKQFKRLTLFQTPNKRIAAISKYDWQVRLLIRDVSYNNNQYSNIQICNYKCLKVCCDFLPCLVTPCCPIQCTLQNRYGRYTWALLTYKMTGLRS